MKKTILFLLCAALLLSLCGCVKGVHDPEPAPSDTEPSAAQPADAPEPADTPEEVILPASIVHETAFDEEAAAVLTVTAKDENGGVIWTYTSPRCYMTELDTVEYIGEFGGLVLINEQALADGGEGGLRALNIADGSTAWVNTDYHGASSHYLFDEERGEIFIGGYYGPDCMSISYSGVTGWIVAQLDENWYWAYDMRFSGEGDTRGIVITFEGSDTGDEVEGFVPLDGVVAMG